MEDMNQEQFKNIPVTRWNISDSDGTIVPFVALSDKDMAKPSKEFIEDIRQQSSDNPDTAFMILTGRQAWELPALYENIFLPDEAGRKPKIVLASENGAYMQFEHIGKDELSENNKKHDNIIEFSKPLDEKTISDIENIIKNAIGKKHYTTNVKDTSPEIWIKAEVKDYGFTFHTGPPESKLELTEYNKAIAEIKEGLKNYGQDNGLLVHLDAASALTIEKVSKGATMERILTSDESMVNFFNNHGLATAQPQWMAYSGDDKGDDAPRELLNKALKEGKIKGGYTSRPSNFTPYDFKGRTPNSPTDPAAADSFFIIGSRDLLPQEQHRANITDTKKAKELSNLREALAGIGLLPSQSGKDNTPPIVLLTTGDILIQKPEDYKASALKKLTSITDRKVILNIDKKEELKRAVLEYPKAFVSENIGIIFKYEVFYSNNSNEKNIKEKVNNEQLNNPITSVDQEVGFQLQHLRALEQVLIKENFIKPDNKTNSLEDYSYDQKEENKTIIEGMQGVIQDNSSQTRQGNDDDSAISINTAAIDEEIDKTLKERWENKPDVSVDRFLEGGKITRKTQYEYTMNLFREQTKNTNTILEKRFGDFKTWSGSKDTRSRQVFIEANTTNIDTIAKAIVNVSPLERITIIGLTDGLKNDLHPALKDVWKDKLEKNETLRESFIKANNMAGNNDLSTVIDNAPLNKLMGPNNFMKDLDISPESLERNFEHYKSNVEEFIVYGTTNALAEQAVHLAEDMKDAPYLTIKQEPFSDNENSLWLLATKEGKVQDMIGLITNGEETDKILGEQVNGNYDNITISKVFKETIDNSSDISQEDKNYLKSIFIEEGIYPPGLSPDAITKMISKATSALGASGAKSVGDALMWNMLNRPVSTARGVEFAVGSMTLDGGNDLVKESLDKKFSYKKHFFTELNNSVTNGKTGSEVLQQTLKKLTGDYNKVENNPDLQKEIKAAEKFRDFGLKEGNSVKRNNDSGVKWLQPLPIGFGLGVALSVVGIVVAVGVAIVLPPVGIALAAIGAGITIAAATATFRSMRFQKAANSVHLPKANVALATANERMYAVKQKRTAILDKLVNVKPEKTKDLVLLADKKSLSESENSTLAKKENTSTVETLSTISTPPDVYSAQEAVKDLANFGMRPDPKPTKKLSEKKPNFKKVQGVGM